MAQRYNPIVQSIFTDLNSLCFTSILRHIYQKGATALSVNRSQQHLLYSVSETSEIQRCYHLNKYRSLRLILMESHDSVYFRKSLLASRASCIETIQMERFETSLKFETAKSFSENKNYVILPISISYILAT